MFLEVAGDLHATVGEHSHSLSKCAAGKRVRAAVLDHTAWRGQGARQGKALVKDTNGGTLWTRVKI